MKRTFVRELDFYVDEHSAGGGEGERGKRPQSVKTHISTTYGQLSEILTLPRFSICKPLFFATYFYTQKADVLFGFR